VRAQAQRYQDTAQLYLALGGSAPQETLGPALGLQRRLRRRHSISGSSMRSSMVPVQLTARAVLVQDPDDALADALAFRGVAEDVAVGQHQAFAVHRTLQVLAVEEAVALDARVLTAFLPGIPR